MGDGAVHLEFSIELPLRRSGSSATSPTHVVDLAGDPDRFWVELRELLAGGCDAATLLTSPVASLGSIADALNATGAATVQSIDEVGPDVGR